MSGVSCSFNLVRPDSCVCDFCAPEVANSFYDVFKSASVSPSFQDSSIALWGMKYVSEELSKAAFLEKLNTLQLKSITIRSTEGCIDKKN